MTHLRVAPKSELSTLKFLKDVGKQEKRLPTDVQKYKYRYLSFYYPPPDRFLNVFIQLHFEI